MDIDPHAFLSVGTVRPAELQRLLSDPTSAFYQDPAVQVLTPGVRDRLVQQLMMLASGGTNVYPHNFNTRTPQEIGLAMEDLRSLGYATETLGLMITVPDSEGRPVQLISGEFNAWQGTLSRSNKTSTLDAAPDQTIDVWARDRNIMIQDSGPSYVAGEQRFAMETLVGSQRVIRGGQDVTRPFTVNYGSEEIIDRDPHSSTRGHPINMGDGALDAYLPQDLLQNNIEQGQPCYGPVLVRLRMEGPRPDPRVYYLSPELPNAAAAILRESENWQEGPRTEVRELAGVRFREPVMLQNSLIADYQRADRPIGFIAMSGAQYQAWKYALSEHAELRSVSPIDWIEQTFGGREQFEAAFRRFPDGRLLTREEYHHALPEYQRFVGAPANIQTLEQLLREDGFMPGGAVDGRVDAATLNAASNARVTLVRLGVEGASDISVDTVLSPELLEVLQRAREQGIVLNPSASVTSPRPPGEGQGQAQTH